MAEAIGIAASVITFGALSVSVYKFSKRLYQAAKDLPDLEEDIMRNVFLLDSSATAIASCHTALRHRELQGDETKVLTELRQNGTLDRLDESIRHVEVRFEILVERLENLKSHIALKSQLKWQNRKPKFDELMVQLECIKTTITIIMLITILELNTLEAEKLASALHGEDMRSVRQAIGKRLDQDSRIYRDTLQLQQSRVKSSQWLNLRRQVERSSESDAFSNPEIIFEDLSNLLDMARQIERKGRWTPAPILVESAPEMQLSVSERPREPNRLLEYMESDAKSPESTSNGWADHRVPILYVGEASKRRRMDIQLAVDALSTDENLPYPGTMGTSPEIRWWTIPAEFDDRLPSNVVVMSLAEAKRYGISLSYDNYELGISISIDTDRKSVLGRARCRTMLSWQFVPSQSMVYVVDKLIGTGVIVGNDTAMNGF